jgi:hypothetical protein
MHISHHEGDYESYAQSLECSCFGFHLFEVSVYLLSIIEAFCHAHIYCLPESLSCNETLK